MPPLVEKYGGTPVVDAYSVHVPLVVPLFEPNAQNALVVQDHVADEKSIEPPPVGQTSNVIHVVSLSPPAATGVWRSASLRALNQIV